MIQLAALETKADDERRLLTKLEFFRCLHQHGWPVEKSMNIYRFLDLILTLSPKFEVYYLEKAKEIDQEFDMKLTLTAERHGFEQGLQQGLEQGLQAGMQQGMQQGLQRGEALLLTSLLKAKFKALPESYAKKISAADVKTLNR